MSNVLSAILRLLARDVGRVQREPGVAMPRSNLYKQVQIPISDITWAALRKYAREHDITIEEAGRRVIRLAIKMIKDEKKHEA